MDFFCGWVVGAFLGVMLGYSLANVPVLRARAEYHREEAERYRKMWLELTNRLVGLGHRIIREDWVPSWKGNVPPPEELPKVAPPPQERERS